MSWWSSLIHGVGSAVDWVKSNSGTIGTAAGIIAKVAGAIADDHSDPVAQIFPNFIKAAQRLKKKAQKGAQAKLDEVSASLPDRIKNDKTRKTEEAASLSDSTFMWVDPAPLNADGQPNKSLVHDIGKMLAQSSFPTVLKAGNGKGKREGSDSGFLDVALSIGQAIFANMATDAEYADDDGIVVSPFSISSTDGCCTISGCHAYYPIPLGQTGANSVWHAAIAMNKTTTEAYRFHEFASTRALTISQPVKMDNGSGNPQWLVTMSVPWEDAVSASKLAPALLNELQSTDVTQVGWRLYYHSLDGTDQRLKLQCPDGFTPAQAKGLVRGCIKDVVRSSGMLLSPNASPYLTPDILVTMSTLVFGGDN
ncbi:hypothetical protein QC764_606710 [Podospora pseudoanserina]|uniref:Uncharacterized protein n=1 Tax=Podospora pseudoanserina TaxID=2609844 RepID=A0ABR0HU86_9PEZI|nr:hypothetical protein QC764_606710 [Podospora pseudoanserina]